MKKSINYWHYRSVRFVLGRATTSLSVVERLSWHERLLLLPLALLRASRIASILAISTHCATGDFYRPTDVVNLWGDPTKAKKELGWNPQTTSFEELVRIMVNHDMQKVAADHVASVMRTNLAEYLEKGIVK